jgi:hypothetical protein
MNFFFSLAIWMYRAQLYTPYHRILGYWSVCAIWKRLSFVVLCVKAIAHANAERITFGVLVTLLVRTVFSI